MKITTTSDYDPFLYAIGVPATVATSTETSYPHWKSRNERLITRLPLKTNSGPLSIKSPRLPCPHPEPATRSLPPSASHSRPLLLTSEPAKSSSTTGELAKQSQPSRSNKSLSLSGSLRFPPPPEPPFTPMAERRSSFLLDSGRCPRRPLPG